MSALVKVTDEGQAIVETLTIASTQVTIAHPADPALPLTIPGYTQTSTPIPLINQFFVNYATGVISFNPGNSGAVTISYSSLGENVDSVYINQLIDYINAFGVPKYAFEEVRFTAITGPHTYELALSKIPVAITGFSLKDQSSGVWLSRQIPVVDISLVTEASTQFSPNIAAGWATSESVVITLIDGASVLTNGDSYRAYITYLTFQ